MLPWKPGKMAAPDFLWWMQCLDIDPLSAGEFGKFLCSLFFELVG